MKAQDNLERGQYLIVYSDHFPCRRYYSANFLARGYAAVESSTYEECAQLALVAPPSLVLICGLPDLPEHVVEEVRQCADLVDIPLAVVTAGEAAPEWLARWGIAVHLLHPMPFDQLPAILGPYLPPRHTIARPESIARATQLTLSIPSPLH